MPPAARLTDMHVCPMFTGPVPHVGGPISGPGAPTVLIGGLPAARVTDMAVCAGPPDLIAMGSFKVLIANMPAARLCRNVRQLVSVAGCRSEAVSGQDAADRAGSYPVVAPE